ncbi:hypothetical protein NL393_34815, partial [Klebsiella pneumoniae]|nr:hypothetical protein [Klebsiella pneumoniae]
REIQQVLIDSLRQWEARTNALVAMPSPAAVINGSAYRECMRRAMALEASAAREQAVAFCGSDIR